VFFSPDGSGTLLNKKRYFCCRKRATKGAAFRVYKNYFFLIKVERTAGLATKKIR